MKNNLTKETETAKLTGNERIIVVNKDGFDEIILKDIVEYIKSHMED